MGMSLLYQKEVYEQMYLFVKRWLDDLPFEESRKVPVMAISYCLARLAKQEELIDAQRKNLMILLNEQEAVEPLFNEQMKHFVCPNCFLVLDEGRDDYCPSCGKRIAWVEYYIHEDETESW